MDNDLEILVQVCSEALHKPKNSNRLYWPIKVKMLIGWR